jgi:tetratricopeptide (TPR) repeat protein
LGKALSRKGDVDGAIACFEKTIELEPQAAHAQYNLGKALSRKGDVDGAIACYKRAIELEPQHAESHCNLGKVLARQGQFAESLVSYKRGHELGSKRPDWRYPSAAWVHQAEQKAALEANLLAYLKDEFKPGNTSETLALSGVARDKKLYYAATHLHTAAIAADPKLADNLTAGHRYRAACYAAQAAAGAGVDDPPPDDAAKSNLRGQALEWLKGDLALWTTRFQTGKSADRAAVKQKLLHWQNDPNLASIREKESLAKLPADEQKAFTQLWADVASLLKKAESPAAKEGKR